MTFTPANITVNCQFYPLLPTCQPAVIAFMAFLVQNFGNSYDKHFTNAESNECNNDEENYDFIIVGAGTAGCVIANRLSEIKKWKVNDEKNYFYTISAKIKTFIYQILVLEAGEEEPLIADVPGFSKLLIGSNVDWSYQSEPEPIACSDNPSRRCTLTSGKMMGGSSSLNSMAYVKGNREDYDEWSRLGNVGWSYDEISQYFFKSLDYHNVSFIILKK